MHVQYYLLCRVSILFFGLSSGGSQMNLSGSAIGVPTSDQAKLLSDGTMSSTLNANKYATDA